MSEKDSIENPVAASSQEAVNRCTRPASQWQKELELRLTELSAQRRQIRQAIAFQKQERRARNPKGEESLSVRTAQQMAKAEVLGKEWQFTVISASQAASKVRSLRRQLESLATAKHLAKQQAGWWTYRLAKRPFLAWKMRRLARRLRHAHYEKRHAYRTLRGLRSTARRPEVRTRILALTEAFLLQDERLKHNLTSIDKTLQLLDTKVSQALRLISQLRLLGERAVTMEQRIDGKTGQSLIPVPIESLVSVQSQSKKLKLRMA